MSYNNLNNYTPFGFRDSLSLVTSKVQEIQVGYMHPYRISLTGSNLTYTAQQLLNNSIDRYQTTDPSQSKFYWGSRSLQTGDQFNAKTWNDVPDAPKTAWGLFIIDGFYLFPCWS